METTGGISYNQIRKEAVPPLLPCRADCPVFHAKTEKVFLNIEDKAPDKATEGEAKPEGKEKKAVSGYEIIAGPRRTMAIGRPSSPRKIQDAKTAESDETLRRFVPKYGTSFANHPLLL